MSRYNHHSHYEFGLRLLLTNLQMVHQVKYQSAMERKICWQ